MPIEFECSGCGQMLRVPDTAVGKQAKCPSCERVLQVPAATAPPVIPTHDEGPSEAANPYAAPQTAGDRMAGSPQHPLIDGKLDPGLALSIAWERFKPHLAVLIGAWLLQMLIQMVFGGVSSVIQSLMGDSAIVVVGIGFIISLVSTAISVFLQQGMIALNLAVCRGQTAEFGLLFSQSRSFGPAFLINLAVILFPTLLFQIAAIIGGPVVVIPLLIVYAIGIIYLTLTYWPVYHLLVDRDVSVGEALGLAGKFTVGNKLSTVLLFIIAMGIAILGVLALCVGIVVAAPLVTLMYTVGYLMITSQPIYGYN